MPADDTLIETGAEIAEQAGAAFESEDAVATKEVDPQFRIGAVLGRGFSILFRNIVRFGLLGLIFYTPFVAMVVTGTASEAAFDENPWLAALFLLSLFAFPFLYLLLNATVVYCTIQNLHGARATLGAGLRRGLATIFPVLGTGVLVAFVVVLGFVALVIPGFIILVMVWVAIPVAVIERRTPIEAMSRSIDLTDGYRWRVLGVVLLVILMNAAVNVVGDMVPIASMVGDAPQPSQSTRSSTSSQPCCSPSSALSGTTTCVR